MFPTTPQIMGPGSDYEPGPATTLSHPLCPWKHPRGDTSSAPLGAQGTVCHSPQHPFRHSASTADKDSPGHGLQEHHAWPWMGAGTCLGAAATPPAYGSSSLMSLLVKKSSRPSSTRVMLLSSLFSWTTGCTCGQAWSSAWSSATGGLPEPPRQPKTHCTNKYSPHIPSGTLLAGALPL